MLLCELGREHSWRTIMTVLCLPSVLCTRRFDHMPGFIDNGGGCEQGPSQRWEKKRRRAGSAPALPDNPTTSSAANPQPPCVRLHEVPGLPAGKRRRAQGDIPPKLQAILEAERSSPPPEQVAPCPYPSIAKPVTGCTCDQPCRATAPFELVKAVQGMTRPFWHGWVGQPGAWQGQQQCPVMCLPLHAGSLLRL